MTKYYYDSELNHHGIKGQKWGVRRYQNYDGSYTSEGLRRRGINIGKKIKQSQNYISSKLKNPKVQKAIKIGKVVAGTALAAYGAYKLSEYMSDQKVLMTLNENANTIRKIIPQYKANIMAMNKGLASKDHYDEYMRGFRANKEILSGINAKKRNITKKHLYNLGENLTISQYNNAVQAGKDVAKATGKVALNVAKTSAEIGKDAIEFILANSGSIAELLVAIS